MRSHLVEMAAQDDYDYVTYIDANTNHHIRYLSSHSSRKPASPGGERQLQKQLMEYSQAIFLWMNGKKLPSYALTM